MLKKYAVNGLRLRRRPAPQSGQKRHGEMIWVTRLACPAVTIGWRGRSFRRRPREVKNRAATVRERSVCVCRVTLLTSPNSVNQAPGSGKYKHAAQASEFRRVPRTLVGIDPRLRSVFHSECSIGMRANPHGRGALSTVATRSFLSF